MPDARNWTITEWFYISLRAIIGFSMAWLVIFGIPFVFFVLILALLGRLREF